MTGASFNLRVGGRVWLDGQGWEVAELTGASARLIADGRLRTVSITSLIGATDPAADDESQDGEDGSRRLWVIPSVVLAGLTTKQADALTVKLHTLRQVIEPEPDDARTLTQRYGDAATAPGVSRRTLERQVARLVELGPAGLVDTRMLQEVRRAVDLRWDGVCLQVLASYTNQSNPTKQTVIRRTNEEFLRQVPDGKVPSLSVAYHRLEELDHGRYTFGAAKQRRSVAKRPTGVLGRLRADRPGQYVLLDSYRLDVFAMEPVTLRWVNTELTVAMDLFDQRVTGIRLPPVAAQSPDVASVLFQTVTPQTWGWAAGSPEGPYGGLPEHLVVVIRVGCCRTRSWSTTARSICPSTPAGCASGWGSRSSRRSRTSRPTNPRSSGSSGRCGSRCWNTCPATRAPTLPPVATMSRVRRSTTSPSWNRSSANGWGRVYHHTAHAGLVDPLERSVALSPAEMFERGIAAAGRIRLPARADLVYDFLEVEWRTIQHYGVEIGGQRYDGPGLNDYRGTHSPHGGAHPGKWPFMVDRDDVRTVYFRDPATKVWHRLEWEHAVQINAPFSADAAAYVRAIGAKTHRHVDPQQAVHDLLRDWTAGEVATRRNREPGHQAECPTRHRRGSRCRCRRRTAEGITTGRGRPPRPPQRPGGGVDR